ncbi:MAG: 3-hexulose-6-phosphate synthase [Methanobacterium sp.]|jgi:3-hexulose-6-phosphate synthase|uniref:RraA family protein n=1 Tax=Methanobacterium sp. TaxID=2164 RepID=UPI0003C9EBDF|nr:RraA family protein [Methanobacterium sp.]MDI3550796.1 3-hexulose-6-phosphate synthase [Methanobacterium sp.]CDG64498.1 dimethylmenaquinone methyltransferase [Methanobacterium sp. MB1]
MAEKMGFSPESLLKQFSSKRKVKETDLSLENLGLSTSQISDALKNLTGEYGVVPGVKPIKDNLKISGKVITVKTQQDDWGTSLKAVETSSKGDVIFIACDGDEVGVWGEMFSKYAQKKGVQSTVVYGAVRDVEAVRELDYPVFSRSIVPHAGTPRAEGEINIPVECGEVTVKTGDWIFGDNCGVVVIQAEVLDQVISEALKIKRTEEEIIHQISEGKPLSDILGIK